MALEEKMNNVKYQGRDDYRVVYFDVQEGNESTKYFFLNEGKDRLKNGNIIATTNLKVAIGANKPEELADIGVVSPEGKVVIPFNNRKVKVLNEDTLLVEPVTPVSEKVKKAIEDRSNPTEATRLVTAANTIKEKITQNIGAEGKFVFNDLFSEATIYDIDGNNLVNNEYFSFISVSDSKIALCKNDPEEEVVSLALGEEKVEEVAEDNVEENVEEVTPENTEENLDVSNVNVDENVVEDAFNSQEEVLDESNTEEEVVEEATTDEVTENVEDNSNEEVVENHEEETVEDTNELEESVDSEVEENIEDDLVEEDVNDNASAEEVEEMPNVDLVQFTPQQLVETDEDDMDMTEDTVDTDDMQDLEEKETVDDSYENFGDVVEDTQVDVSDATEAAAIVDKLVNKMRSLEDHNNNLEEELNETKEKVSQLTMDNRKLEEKADYYKRAATSLLSENERLKDKVKNSEQLFTALHEASKWLKDDDEKYGFDEENVFKRIA